MKNPDKIPAVPKVPEPKPKPKVIFAVAMLKISDAGEYDLTVRQQTTGPNSQGQQEYAFGEAGPVVWHETVSSPFLAMFIKNKIRLFT